MIPIANRAGYCLRCGAPMEIRLLYGRERAACPVCGYIHFRNPTPVAGCIVEYEGGIVLIRRGIEPGYGMWGLPAGYMEIGETAEEGAMRETAEETGLIVQITRLLGVYSVVNPLGGNVLIFYVAQAAQGPLVPGDDELEAAVFAPDTLPDTIAFSTHWQALTDYLGSIPAR